MRWFISPLMMAFGIVMMKYCVKAGQLSGPIAFAEDKLKMFGGTYGMWRLIGLALVLFGLAWLTGVVDLSGSQDITITFATFDM